MRIFRFANVNDKSIKLGQGSDACENRRMAVDGDASNPS
jgi:hypothetical protein